MLLLIPQHLHSRPNPAPCALVMMLSRSSLRPITLILPQITYPPNAFTSLILIHHISSKQFQAEAVCSSRDQSSTSLCRRNCRHDQSSICIVRPQPNVVDLLHLHFNFIASAPLSISMSWLCTLSFSPCIAIGPSHDLLPNDKKAPA